MAKHETPLLDQLESGPWPSFVSDMKQEAERRAKNPDNVEYQIPVDVVDDLLGLLAAVLADMVLDNMHGCATTFHAQIARWWRLVGALF